MGYIDNNERSDSSYHPAAMSVSSINHHHHHHHHRQSIGNQHANSSKYEPAYPGAKFDKSGYCLKHPMVRLCKPSPNSAAKNPKLLKTSSPSNDNSPIASDTSSDEEDRVSPQYKYIIIRKICPMCGEHSLRNERKFNKPVWAHGYEAPKLLERMASKEIFVGTDIHIAKRGSLGSGGGTSGQRSGSSGIGSSGYAPDCPRSLGTTGWSPSSSPSDSPSSTAMNQRRTMPTPPSADIPSRGRSLHRENSGYSVHTAVIPRRDSSLHSTRTHNVATNNRREFLSERLAAREQGRDSSLTSRRTTRTTMSSAARERDSSLTSSRRIDKARDSSLCSSRGTRLTTLDDDYDRQQHQYHRQRSSSRNSVRTSRSIGRRHQDLPLSTNELGGGVGSANVKDNAIFHPKNYHANHHNHDRKEEPRGRTLTSHLSNSTRRSLSASSKKTMKTTPAGHRSSKNEKGYSSNEANNEYPCPEERKRAEGKSPFFSSPSLSKKAPSADSHYYGASDDRNEIKQGGSKSGQSLAKRISSHMHRKNSDGSSTSHNTSTTANTSDSSDASAASTSAGSLTRRRSLSRKASRVLKTTRIMDGTKDEEPCTMRYEVPFHPVTGTCNYHPEVCLAVKNRGGRGGWKIVREECPKCKYSFT